MSRYSETIYLSNLQVATRTSVQKFNNEASTYLSQPDQDTIRQHTVSNPRRVDTVVEQALAATRQKQAICHSEGWIIEFRRQRISLQQEAYKVVKWLDRVKKVGDAASNTDSIYLGLPWAGIRLLLHVGITGYIINATTNVVVKVLLYTDCAQVAVSEKFHMAALLISLETAFYSLNRLQAYMNYLVMLPRGLARGKIEFSLLELQVLILRFLSGAIRIHQERSVAREFESSWGFENVIDFEDKCQKIAVQLEYDWHKELCVALEQVESIHTVQNPIEAPKTKLDLSKLLLAAGGSFDSLQDGLNSRCHPDIRVDLVQRNSSEASSVGLSPDGPRFASGLEGDTVCVGNAGQCELVPITSSQTSRRAQQLSPDHAPLFDFPEFRRYEPLAPGEIRLLHLDHNEAGSGFLRHYSLSNVPRFHALSYHWGKLTRTKTFTLEQVKVDLRETVWDFLISLVHAFGSCVVWLDVLCINQRDFAERNRQVSIMHHIFRGAADVYAWLGVSDSSIDAVFEKMLEYPRITWKDPGKEVSVNYYQRHLQKLAIFLGCLASRPYWQRLWIIQELINAQTVIITYGPHIWDYDDFCSILLAYPPLKTRFDVQFVRKYRQNPGKFTLSCILHEFAQYACTDLRDKLYGLRSLCDELAQINVDYSKSVRDIYLDLLRNGLLNMPDGLQAAARMLDHMHLTPDNLLEDVGDIQKDAIPLIARGVWKVTEVRSKVTTVQSHPLLSFAISLNESGRIAFGLGPGIGIGGHFSFLIQEGHFIVLLSECPNSKPSGINAAVLKFGGAGMLKVVGSVILRVFHAELAASHLDVIVRRPEANAEIYNSRKLPSFLNLERNRPKEDCVELLIDRQSAATMLMEEYRSFRRSYDCTCRESHARENQGGKRNIKQPECYRYF